MQLVSGLPPVLTLEQEKAFRSELCSYVEQSRDAGALPEHVIIAVREAIARAIPRLSPSVAEAAIRWCIEHYFR